MTKPDRKLRVWVSEGLTCMRREMDARRLSSYFEANDCEIVSKPSEADLNVLVTCAFTEAYENASFQQLEDLKKTGAELFVTGCLPGVAPKRLADAFEGASLKAKDLEQVDSLFPDHQVSIRSISEQPHALTVTMKGPAAFRNHDPQDHITVSGADAHTLMFYKREAFARARSPGLKTATLRTCNGCLLHCTFCHIRNSTGDLVSKSLEQCRAEYETYLDQGYRHFVFTGDETGCYGLDIGSSLPELMDNLAALEGDLDIKWSIEALEPQYLVRYLPELRDWARRGKFLQIEAPIQSASNRVLKWMGRPYEIQPVIEALEDICDAAPDLEFWTVVIIGFPSESDDEFASTLRMLNHDKIAGGYAIAYSGSHDGKASKLKGTLPEGIVRARMAATVEALQGSSLMRCMENSALNVLGKRYMNGRDSILG